MKSEYQQYIKKAKESLLASQILTENQLYNFALPEPTIPYFIWPKHFCGSKI